jgi:hypothetical protein
LFNNQPVVEEPK